MRQPASTQGGGSERRREGVLVARLLVVASCLALALWAGGLHDVVLDHDEAVYAVVARSWAAGALPYRDVFDHKPPVVYLVYRAVFAVFGESLAAVRAVFAIITALTGVALALALRVARPATPPWLLAAAALAAVYFLSCSTTSAGTANCEVPMMLLVGGAALAALQYRQRRRWWWMGLLGLSGSLALLTKPVCAVEVALFVAVALAGDRAAKEKAHSTWTVLAAGGAGAALPLVVAVSYFAVHRALAPAIEAVIGYNFRYAAVPPLPWGTSALALLRESAIGFAPLLAGAVLLAWQAVRGERSFAGWLFALWTVAAAVGTLAPGRPYLHYLGQLALPLVGVSAVAVAALSERAAGRRSRSSRLWVAAALVLLLPSLRATVVLERESFAVDNWEEELGLWLAARCGASERIHVWGAAPEIYWFARRRPASRFIYKYPMLGLSPFADAARREQLTALVAEKPAAIVVMRRDRSTEDATTSESEWQSYWAPTLGSLLAGYARAENDRTIVYLRR